MKVNIQIDCPTCHHPIDFKNHRGVIINRVNFLRSQTISLREQLVRVEARKPNPPKITAVELENQKQKILEQLDKMDGEIVVLEAMME